VAPESAWRHLVLDMISGHDLESRACKIKDNAQHVLRAFGMVTRASSSISKLARLFKSVHIVQKRPP